MATVPFRLLCPVALAALATFLGSGAAANEAIYWSQGGFSDGRVLHTLLADPGQTVVLTSRSEAVSQVAVDDVGQSLYWTGGDGIYRASLRGTSSELVASSAAFSEGLALDVASQHIYWTNYAGEIRRADFDGSDEVLLRSEGQTLFGLALDLVYGRMYWTASDDGIYRANLDGSDPQQIATGGDEPLGVAVDPNGGKVYWAEWGSGTLRRTDLNGFTSPEVIYTSATGQPIGIAVDATTGKLYWTEWSTLLLRRADLDGSQVETVAVADERPWGVALGPQSPPLPAPIVQLSQNTILNVEPDVDSGRVVWRGYGPAGTAEIFLWDGGMVQQVTEDGIHDHGPHISGPNLSWIHDSDGSGRAFFWNGTEPPVQVSNHVMNPGVHCLDGTQITYPFYDGSDLEIIVWDDGVLTQLTQNGVPDSAPCISGNHMIWVRTFPDGSDSEVVHWDGSTETRLTDNAGEEIFPILDGGHAAWATQEEGDWHVFFWDGTTVQRIESPATNERYPDISGGRVVWAGLDGSPQNDSEIYLWEDGEILQLTDNDVEDYEPAISGRHVVWSGSVDGNAEILLATLPEPEPMPVPAVSLWGSLALAASLLAAGARRVAVFSRR